MGSRPTVVLDSNVLVSALGWRGAPHDVYRLCRDRTLRLLTSPELIDELGRVLAYPKFEFSLEERERFLSDLRRHSDLMEPEIELRVILDDPADNRVLELAVAGNADWIVSGDQHLLALGGHEGVRIGTARELLTRLEG